MKFIQTTDFQRRNIKYVGVCLLMILAMILMMCLSSCTSVMGKQEVIDQQKEYIEILEKENKTLKNRSRDKYTDSVYIVTDGMHYTIPARYNEKNK